MMSWLLSQPLPARLLRRRRSPSHSAAESLEARLCAGSLNALPALLPTDLDDSPQQTVNSATASTTKAGRSLRIAWDFRDLPNSPNLINSQQQHIAEQALKAWEQAAAGRIQFYRDTSSPLDSILNIGIGSLNPLNLPSTPGGLLGVGGSNLLNSSENHSVHGLVWLDSSETWGSNSTSAGQPDLFTAFAHETGHALGLPDTSSGVMNSNYSGPATIGDFPNLNSASNSGTAAVSPVNGGTATAPAANSTPAATTGTTAKTPVATTRNFPVYGLGDPQLTAAEVGILLDRASAATPSNDAIIAVVDREGTILGVRTESGVSAPDNQTLAFMIDGAVAKARTAAMFSNGDPSAGTVGPLTSRTIRFLSQTTITQREVESNPNSADPTVQGPGFVAPIGVGGHFPPEIRHTPPVDLFAIEHTNRDSLLHAGLNGIRENGGGDDLLLSARFDATFAAGKDVPAPESWGFVTGLAPTQQSRGIATLPGGIPLFRDTNSDTIGDTLVGGIGVFFPGPAGFASWEQGFAPGQSETARTNAPKVLEAEIIALAAAGGSRTAEIFGTGAPGAHIDTLDGIPAIPDIDLPFDHITLVGIDLEIVGPTPGIEGVRQTVALAQSLGPGTVNGVNQPVAPGGIQLLPGGAVPSGWLVPPQNGTGITAAEVQQIIDEGIIAADKTRAAIRVPAGSRTRMVLAVTDTTGEVVGLYRMPDATFFSIDVAVAKARNTAYYASTALQPVDAVDGVPAETAFTNRTFRFLAEPRFPAGVEGTQPPAFSTLNQIKNPEINPRTAENIGSPVPASDMYDTVLGFDAFNPGRNFQDAATSLRHQNGIVFFPGSTPLYRDGQLIGGLGVSGDGVDQDDVVTFLAAQDFLPRQNGVLSADDVFVDGVRLPYIKFNRVPFG
ncbi:MAG: hypothetical protein RIT02_2059 [Planctomycetota bacterium]|jgi:uncharacterized protein GlcG (DUF336 family)